MYGGSLERLTMIEFDLCLHIQFLCIYIHASMHHMYVSMFNFRISGVY